MRKLIKVIVNSFRINELIWIIFCTYYINIDLILEQRLNFYIMCIHFEVFHYFCHK